MRIGIDTRYVYDHFPGIGRYVINLARALGELDHPHTLILFVNPDLPNTRHNLDNLQYYPSIHVLHTSARPFSAMEQVQLPHLARMLRLDVLHSPYYIKPYVGMPCPSVVTIYDLIGKRFPSVLSLRARLLFNLTTWLAVRSSQRILTISTSSRNDIVSFYRVPAEHVIATPLAADPHFQPQPAHLIEAVKATYNLPDRYVLYLGSNKPHKNLECLVQAWYQIKQSGALANADVCLVIAGHYDPRYPQARKIVEKHGLSDSVCFVAHVAEADLPALYSGAEVFVFPSFYEGFGLPPLEAMACGTPVISADTSSLPEVVGNAALTVDPTSVDELADNLQWVLASPSLRTQLREKGLHRARQFSWQRTAQETLAVYENLAG